MCILYFLFCYLFGAAVSIKSRPEDDFYYASVVEYAPLEGKDGNDTLFKNAEEYIRIIEKAAKLADIVVFPELGLNYIDDTVYVEIPFGNETLVNNHTLHPVLMKLSKAAKDYQVYISFTIHEKYKSSNGEVLRYNTNVVFDRKGDIVARYRKYNLFNEDHLNITKVPEVVSFDSDFGVRFGMFICFDIFFKEPALTLVNEKQITDIIYPSWWFSELPSLLSVQMQFAWAYMTDTNLLAAGISSIQRSSTGSGIYGGKTGSFQYMFSEQNQTTILVSKVYKRGIKGDLHSDGKELRKDLYHGSDLQLWSEDLSLYDTQLLTPTHINDSDFQSNLILNKIVNQTICQGSLCCEFNINMTFTYQPEDKLNMSDVSYIKNDSFFHYEYRLAVRDGVRGFYGSKLAGIQVCSIIPCLNSSLSSCGKKSGNTLPLIIKTPKYRNIFLYSTSFNTISIKAVSNIYTDFTFPDILESSNSLSPKAFGSLPNVLKLTFDTNHYTSNLKYSSERLAFAAIYSRVVSRDGSESSSGKCVPYTFLSCSMAILVIFSLKKIYNV